MIMMMIMRIDMTWLESVSTFNICAAVMIWALALLGGALALYVSKWNQALTSSLQMFAAGVFLAASLMHMLPDAVKSKGLKRMGCPTDDPDCEEPFPLAYMFYGTGFLMILFIEVLAHSMQVCHHKEEAIPLITHSGVARKLADETELPSTTQPHSHQNDKHNSECTGIVVPNHHIHGVLADWDFISILVYVSLSFHSIMEGVGMGSQSKPAWDIFLAIIAHKAIAAFALGMELVSHKVPRFKYMLALAVFALMTPLGIFLGWAIAGDSIDSASSAISTSLAGGTFLFVAVVEIIPQELVKKENMLLKGGMLLVGYVGFGILAKWT